jgi:hypothetical protein
MAPRLFGGLPKSARQRRAQSEAYSTTTTPQSSNTTATPQSPTQPSTSTNNNSNNNNYQQNLVEIGKIIFDKRRVLGRGSENTCVYEGTFEKNTQVAVKRVLATTLV